MAPVVMIILANYSWRMSIVAMLSYAVYYWVVIDDQRMVNRVYSKDNNWDHNNLSRNNRYTY